MYIVHYTHPRPYVHTYDTCMHCYSSTYVEKKYTLARRRQMTARVQIICACACTRAKWSSCPSPHRTTHGSTKKKRSIVWVLYPAACFRKNFNFTNKNTQRIFFQNIMCTMKYVCNMYIRIYSYMSDDVFVMCGGSAAAAFCVRFEWKQARVGHSVAPLFITCWIIFLFLFWVLVVTKLWKSMSNIEFNFYIFH